MSAVSGTPSPDRIAGESAFSSDSVEELAKMSYGGDRKKGGYAGEKRQARVNRPARAMPELSYIRCNRAPR